jgi:hypothetical protein
MSAELITSWFRRSVDNDERRLETGIMIRPLGSWARTSAVDSDRVAGSGAVDGSVFQRFSGNKPRISAIGISMLEGTPSASGVGGVGASVGCGMPVTLGAIATLTLGL